MFDNTAKSRFSLLHFSDFWMWTFIVLIVLYVLPIWIFKYFPSQDGPSHIYNSFILRHYNDPRYVFAKFYEIRKAPVPNWASHAIMMLLTYLVPPLIAEKLLLTIYVVLMAFSMFYLLRSVQKDKIPLVFLGFPFIYNYILLMGFYNFSIGTALFMLIIGYWWRHYDAFCPKNSLILALLLILLYFCHLVPLVLAILAITLLASWNVVTRPSRWSGTILSLVSFLPATGLSAYYLFTRGTAHSSSSWTLKQLCNYFIRNESLAYHSQSQMIFGELVAGAIGLLFIYTVVKDHLFDSNWHWKPRLCRRDLFLLLGILFFRNVLGRAINPHYTLLAVGPFRLRIVTQPAYLSIFLKDAIL